MVVIVRCDYLSDKAVGWDGVVDGEGWRLVVVVGLSPACCGRESRSARLCQPGGVCRAEQVTVERREGVGRERAGLQCQRATCFCGGGAVLGLGGRTVAK